MKTIIVMDYPQTFGFKVRKDLPFFDNDEDVYCEVRQEILLRQFKRQNIYSPCHGYNEYVVSIVEPFDNGTISGEIWHLSS